MLLRLAYRGGDGSPAKRFLPLMPPVTGRVTFAAVRGTYLHLFFGDGTHRRYVPSRMVWTTRSAPPQFVEVRLPESGLPMAIASDAARGVLYALVPSAQADAIQMTRRTGLDPNDQEAAEDAAESGMPSAQRPPPEPSVGPALARYEDGRWEYDRRAPPELGSDALVLQMLASDGTVHLLYGPDPGQRTFVHRISVSIDAAWSDPAPLPLTDVPTLCSSGWVDAAPVVLVGERQRGGTSVRPLRFADDTWSTGPALVDDTGDLAVFADPVGATVFDSEIAIAAIGDSGHIEFGRWALDTGKLLEPVAAIRPLVPQAKPFISQTGRIFIQYSILAGVLAAVFVWRRESVLRAVPLQPGQTFARLSYRAAALAVDLTILLPLWIPVIYRLWRPQGDGLTAFEYLQTGPADVSEGMLWSSAIIGAIVGLYALIFEAAIGATPGKRILGLSVVREGGQPCRLGAVAIRNFVRVIEFEFLPVVLLVALTPARQRLGDLLARTVVVEQSRFPSSNSSQPDNNVTDDRSQT